MIGAGVGPRQVGLRGRACEQRLRDGVAIPRHRRDVVHVIASNVAHWLISTQVQRRGRDPSRRREGADLLREVR